MKASLLFQDCAEIYAIVEKVIKMQVFDMSYQKQFWTKVKTL